MLGSPHQLITIGSGEHPITKEIGIFFAVATTSDINGALDVISKYKKEVTSKDVDLKLMSIDERKLVIKHDLVNEITGGLTFKN